MRLPLRRASVYGRGFQVLAIVGGMSEIDILVSPTGEILAVAKVSSQQRSWERTMEQTGNVPVPQVVKQTLEVVKVILLERIFQKVSGHALVTPW